MRKVRKRGSREQEKEGEGRGGGREVREARKRGRRRLTFCDCDIPHVALVPFAGGEQLPILQVPQLDTVEKKYKIAYIVFTNQY